MNNLFNSQKSNVPAATVKNLSGGKAYKLDTQVALAKYVCTGTFNDTYQTSAEEQLDRVIEMCKESDPEFLAKLAIYARKHGKMKDSPAVLAAYLAKENIELCKRVFSRVIDDPKMLRNFVQVIRSGVIGRQSLGTAPKKLVQDYLNNLTDEQLFKANVGNNPSLTDIIKMVHPKPASKEREALYAYLIGKTKKSDDKDYLLPLARHFEAYKKQETKELPNVPFLMLTALPLSDEAWATIAERATIDQIRQNLNTFGRHNVFKNERVVDIMAAKLSNPEEIRRSRILPYKLFTTYMHIDNTVPQKIINALQAAVEVALENIPVIEGKVYIALDTSGSMRNRVTGNLGSATTKMRYIDVAALFAAGILRKNKEAVILPFDTSVNSKSVSINPFDSIMTNAQKLAAINGGGTDCSVALQYLNANKLNGDTVIYLSDNESWKYYAGKKYYGRRNGLGTGMMEEWTVFKKNNPKAKLINIDITPNDTTQIANTPDTLLVAGLSDIVFDVVAGFVREENNSDYWMKTISEIKL